VKSRGKDENIREQTRLKARWEKEEGHCEEDLKQKEQKK
jgi:hypothetical protein